MKPSYCYITIAIEAGILVLVWALIFSGWFGHEELNQILPEERMFFKENKLCDIIYLESKFALENYTFSLEDYKFPDRCKPIENLKFVQNVTILESCILDGIIWIMVDEISNTSETAIQVYYSKETHQNECKNVFDIYDGS